MISFSTPSTSALGYAKDKTVLNLIPNKTSSVSQFFYLQKIWVLTSYTMTFHHLIIMHLSDVTNRLSPILFDCIVWFINTHTHTHTHTYIWHFTIRLRHNTLKFAFLIKKPKTQKSWKCWAYIFIFKNIGWLWGGGGCCLEMGHSLHILPESSAALICAIYLSMTHLWTCYHQSFRGLWKRDSLSNIPLVPTFAVLF